VRGDDRLAEKRLRSAISADPLREDAHRGLMTALARLGRQAEALRCYEHCRRVLREELGAAPSPETQAVYEQLLAGQTPPGAPTVRATEELAFLGRDTELRRLRAVLDEPKARVVALVGEPGSGKSRLMAEVVGRPLG